jgi:hypothetical protein
MAADLFAPGSGAAVQIASQEIQRAIKFGAQAAGIGVSGLMKPFCPPGPQISLITTGSPGLAGRSPGWHHSSRISPGQGSGPAPGPAVVVNYTHNGATEDPALNQLTHLLTVQNDDMAARGSR